MPQQELGDAQWLQATPSGSRRRHPGALLPQAGGARQARTGAGERFCAGVDKCVGAARKLAAGGARAAQPAQERRPSRARLGAAAGVERGCGLAARMNSAAEAARAGR
jgi:hypothetical protein